MAAKDLLIVVGVMIAWGGAFTAGRIAVDELTPHTAATLRYLLASVCLVIMLAYREGLRASVARVDRRGLALLVLLALFGVVGYNVLLFAGLEHSSSINGSLIAGLAPLSTALLAAGILRETFTRRHLIGMTISLAGIGVLVTRGSLTVLLNLELSKGDLLILASMVCFGLQSVCAKRAMAYVSPRAAVTYSCLIGSAMLVPFMIGDLINIELSTISFRTWESLIYLAIVATVLAYLGWFHVVERHGAAKPAPFVNLVPIFGASIGVLWGEEVLAAQGIAAVLVLGGVHVASRRPRPAASPGPSADKAPLSPGEAPQSSGGETTP